MNALAFRPESQVPSLDSVGVKCVLGEDQDYFFRN